MTKTEEQDFGYEYVIALCEAIEKVVKKEEAATPHIFTYKELNLRFAVERALYFSYANSASLFDIFTKWKTDSLPKQIQAKDNAQKKLIREMCNVEESKIYVKTGNTGKIIIKSSVRVFINIFRLNTLVSFIRKQINFSNQNKKYQVLFYVINERFVRFMKPIFDKIGVPCAYITTDTKTANYLEKEKIPHVRVSRFGYMLSKLAQKDSTLKRFMITEYYDLLSDSINNIHPKSVVLVEGNVPAYETVNQICKKLNIKSVCIQQGWSPIVHNGFRNMSYTKMLVWGDGFANDLRIYNPKQKFVTVGNFTVETQQSKNITQIKTVALFFHGTGRMIPPKTLEDFLDFTKRLVKDFQNINIIIREHPVYKLDQKIKTELINSGNVVFMSGPEYSLESVMEKSDLNISVYSGTCLESISAGILPLMINITSCPNFFPDIAKLGAGIEVKSTDEALETIKRLIENPNIIQKFKEPMEKFRKEYFAFDKETSMKNIVKEIVN